MSWLHSHSDRRYIRFLIFGFFNEESRGAFFGSWAGARCSDSCSASHSPLRFFFLLLLLNGRGLLMLDASMIKGRLLAEGEVPGDIPQSPTYILIQAASVHDIHPSHSPAYMATYYSDAESHNLRVIQIYMRL